MAQFHNIFCASAAPLSRADIAGALQDAWYGDGEPTFVPAADASAAWQRFEARLPGIGRPVTFLRDSDTAAIGELVVEAIESPPVVLRPETAARLRGTRQVIGVEFAPDGFDDDAWEALDIVQAFIARQLDGLLFTSDGVYDSQLQPTS